MGSFQEKIANHLLKKLPVLITSLKRAENPAALHAVGFAINFDPFKTITTAEDVMMLTSRDELACGLDLLSNNSIALYSKSIIVPLHGT